jgi:hypothetical protein
VPRRVIAHCDIDAFYASVELLRHPVLVDIAESIVGPEVHCQGRYRFRPRASGQQASDFPAPLRTDESPRAHGWLAITSGRNAEAESLWRWFGLALRQVARATR